MCVVLDTQISLWTFTQTPKYHFTSKPCVPASFLRVSQSSRLRQDPLQHLLDPLHPTVLMVALNDLRNFFQPKNSMIFSSLLKAKWRKQQGEEEGWGQDCLAPERRGENAGEQDGVEGVEGWHFSASQCLQENKQSLFHTLSLQ